MPSGLEERARPRLLTALERRLAPAPVPAAASGQLARRIVRFGVTTSIVAVVIQSVLHVTDIVAFDRGVNIFDADDDVTVSGWASTAATFAAALAVLPLAFVTGRRWLFLLAAIFAFFSFDDFIRLHERIAAGVESLGVDESLQLGRLIWALAFFPLLALTAGLLWALTSSLAADEASMLRLALGLLVAAVLLEAASPALFAFGLDHKDWQYETEVVVEEGAELAGWIWIATALMAASCRTLLSLGRST